MQIMLQEEKRSRGIFSPDRTSINQILFWFFKFYIFKLYLLNYQYEVFCTVLLVCPSGDHLLTELIVICKNRLPVDNTFRRKGLLYGSVLFVFCSLIV